MASALRGEQGVRPVRAGSLKEGEPIALALSAAAGRYRSLSRTGKQMLLNELQALTGYHRKSLLRRLNQQPDQRQTSLHGQHRRRYGQEVVEALVPLWEGSDRLCGKRLHVLCRSWWSRLSTTATCSLSRA